jgi:hypothetical protein
MSTTTVSEEQTLPLDNEPDIREEIGTTTEAFMSASTPKYLEELKLEPFSLMRQTIGMELAGPGSSAFFDAIMKVWLCTISDLECLAARADRDKARLAAFKWAESRGYSLNKRERWKPLLDLYSRLDAEIETSLEARAAGTDNGQEGESKNFIGRPQ